LTTEPTRLCRPWPPCFRELAEPVGQTAERPPFRANEVQGASAELLVRLPERVPLNRTTARCDASRSGTCTRVIAGPSIGREHGSDVGAAAQAASELVAFSVAAPWSLLLVADLVQERH
jgi:hypothetical protein